MLKIISVSSLNPRYGMDTLIQACRMLNISWILTLTGDGSEEKSLRNLAKGLPVKFLGRVPPGEVPKLLKKSDLFIRPSRHEGFGNVFIEAMAAGIPVIGTPVGGIVDFLFDNKTGFLVPTDNPKSLSKKIEYIVSNPAKVKKITTYAKNFVRKNYDWDIIAKKVLLEFKKICP